jgi:solute carrier family 35 protein F5
MVVNGLIGTVLSELLWLLGCFYTSSLVATLAISLTIPLTMLADVLVKERGGRLDNPFLKKRFHFY